MVYLIHFNTPLHHARHYIGYSADDLFDKRIECHRSGRGSKLLAHLNRIGTGWHVVRLWLGEDGNFERKLKNNHSSKKLCPICQAQDGQIKLTTRMPKSVNDKIIDDENRPVVS